MKRCPECGREYDNTMMFCLDDGSELLYGPASGSSEPSASADDRFDEPQTAILHEIAPPHEAATRAQIHTTEQTAVFHSAAEAKPHESLGGLTSKHSSSANTAAKPLIAAAVAVLLLFGGFFGYQYFNESRSSAINSIAVLPFENRSGSGDTEYLSDGLADSLIYRLSQLPNLKVSPTSSVMRYKGMAGEAAKVASELGVDSVMTGRLSQIGDNLNISVQLIDVKAGKVLWAEQYDRKMSDLLATQREIATTIAQKLELKLAGNDEVGITKKYTDNNEAYQLYLKGRFYWNKRDEKSLRKAIEQFRAAADKDPNFALALVGLADSYAVLPYYSTAASSEVLPKAEVYAKRALEIDDSLGDAHASLAYIYSQLWNWTESETTFKRAIDLNPSHGTGHRWFGQLLHVLGRYDEAEIEYKRAVELEPLSLVAHNNLAEIYVRKNDLNTAEEQYRKAIELDPKWYFARMGLAEVLATQGRNAEAIAEAEKSVELSNRQNIPLGILGKVYAQTNRKDDAIKIAEELKERQEKQQTAGLDIARVYTGLNEKDQAFNWLEKEFDSRNQKLPIWLAIGFFDSLRDDPRYAALLKRMELPE